MYTFYLKAFRMRRTLVLLTIVSRANCVADFRGDVVNLSKTTTEEAGLVAVRGLPDLPLCTSQMVCHCVSKLATKPCNCQACRRLCLKLTLPLTLNFSDIFKLDIPL